MSVINKVLQDLDQRQAENPAASVAGAAQSDTRLRRGTSSLASRIARLKGQAEPGRRRWLWWLALLPLLAAVAAGVWFVGRGQQQPLALSDAPRLQVVASPAAVVPVESAPPAVVAPPVPAPVPTPAPAWEGLRMDSRLSANFVLNTPKPSTVVAAPPPDKARPVEAAKPAQSPKAPASSGEASPPRRQQATSDAIAQAQAQWNAGLRAEAIGLMEKTVAAAERNIPLGNVGHADATLLVLVRELTRMQVAQGHFGAVWELLSRLEPLLGDQPDLWAIRANAAQRLGRHQDSVHAYMVALQSRPEEPRWLLGAAVSLAASGQLGSAAEMAEKARAHGTVSKDVLAYLRQLGVPLKD